MYELHINSMLVTQIMKYSTKNQEEKGYYCTDLSNNIVFTDYIDWKYNCILIGIIDYFDLERSELHFSDAAPYQRRYVSVKY